MPIARTLSLDLPLLRKVKHSLPAIPPTSFKTIVVVPFWTAPAAAALAVLPFLPWSVPADAQAARAVTMIAIFILVNDRLRFVLIK